MSANIRVGVARHSPWTDSKCEQKYGIQPVMWHVCSGDSKSDAMRKYVQITILIFDLFLRAAS